MKELLAASSPLRRVGVSWFAVNVAEWTYVTALSIHCYRAYGAFAVGLVGARFASGALLGSALLNYLIRRPPTSVLRMLALSRAAAVAAIGLAVAAHAPLAIVVAIVWIDAVIAAPYRPVQSAILPALAATPRELSAAAGSVPSSKALAQAIGALAGGVSLLVIAPDATIALAAVAFGVTAGLVAPLRADATTPVLAAPSAGSGSHARWGTIGTGFSQITHQARPLLILGTTRSLTRGLWTTLCVFTSIRLLHLGNAGVGILMAAAGIGAAAAMAIALRFAGRADLAFPAALSFALAGAPIVMVGLIATAAPAVLLVVVWGAAFSLADSFSNALVHRVVESRLLAPSVAAIESSKLLLEGIGALAAPALLGLVGVRVALIVVGAPLPLLVAVSGSGLLAVDRRAQARERPLAALRATPSFRGMTMLSLESLAARLEPTTVGLGTVIVHEGDVGDRFYLIDSGRVEVTIIGYRVAVLGPGGSFGEKALLRASPRTATVTALEPCRLWYLDGADFVAAATGSEDPVANRVRRSTGQSVEEVLAGVPLFGAIEPHALAALGEVTSSPAGSEIVREGDPGHCFYVLLGGEARVTVGGRPVRILEAGDCFGEIALLHNVPRQATVTAIVEVTLWVLQREPFLAALGDAALLEAGPANGELAGAGLLV